jgi:hypothetical protein
MTSTSPSTPLCRALFARTLPVLDTAFAALVRRVPPPELVQLGAYQHFRTREQTAAQAVIQKLSRIITGLRAVQVLLDAGLYQEVGAMARILDELGEDVILLSESVRTGTVTALQTELLNQFYEEEFDDPNNPLRSTQRRPMVRREKVRAAIAALPYQAVNRSDATELHRTMFHTMSGYVHATSVHILDSWGGDPPHFHLAGMRGTPREGQWEAQGLQYLYRGLTWLMYATMAFGEQALIEQLYTFRQQFEQGAGMTDWPDPDQRVRELRQRGV